MRDPVGGIDLGKRGLTQGIDADEELLDGTEENRGLRPPAVGIAVLIILTAEKSPFLREDPDHLLVPLEDILSDQRGNAALLGELAAIIDRREQLEADLPSQLIVVITMAGSDMDATASGLERHELGRVDGGGAIEEGMVRPKSLKGRTLEGLAVLRQLQSGCFLELLGQTGCNDESLGAILQQYVVEIGMEGDRKVGRESPGSRGPDDDAERLLGREAKTGGLGGMHGKLHEDRRRCLLLILDLRFGKGGLGTGAPENRLLAPVDEPLFHHPSEGADNSRLVGGIECQVGMIPVTEDSEPAELATLDVDELARILLGLLADLQGGEPGRGLHHAELDRQSVAIPSRDERGLEAGHGLRFDDQILEHLVERRPHVDIAVSKGRPVVQDELGSPLAGLLDRGVEPLLLPLGQQLRLTLGQTGLHRKVGLGKSDGVFVAGHGREGVRLKTVRLLGSDGNNQPTRKGLVV